MKLVSQVRALVAVLDEKTKETLTMAEKAEILAKQTPTEPIKETPTSGNSNAAEEQCSTSVSIVKEVGPSVGFLLALKRMLPSLEHLFTVPE